MRQVRVVIDRLVRSRRRSIGLQIMQDGKLTVRAPLHLSENALYRLLSRKERWIRKKKALAIRRNRERVPRQFRTGEFFLFLGKRIPFLVRAGSQGVSLKGSQLLCGAGNGDQGLVIRKWYLKQARIVFQERCDYYSALMGLPSPSVSVGEASTRWGSCSPTGRLRFCFRLVMAPLAVIDCVVVHELVHLKIRNHSARFYRELEHWFPGYEGVDRWLSKNAHLLDLSVNPQRELDRI